MPWRENRRSWRWIREKWPIRYPVRWAEEKQAVKTWRLLRRSPRGRRLQLSPSDSKICSFCASHPTVPANCNDDREQPYPTPTGISCRHASWMARVAVDGIKSTDGQGQFEERQVAADAPRLNRDNDPNLMN